MTLQERAKQFLYSPLAGCETTAGYAEVHAIAESLIRGLLDENDALQKQVEAQAKQVEALMPAPEPRNVTDKSWLRYHDSYFTLDGNRVTPGLLSLLRTVARDTREAWSSAQADELEAIANYLEKEAKKPRRPRRRILTSDQESITTIHARVEQWLQRYGSAAMLSHEAELIRDLIAEVARLQQPIHARAEQLRDYVQHKPDCPAAVLGGRQGADRGVADDGASLR